MLLSVFKILGLFFKDHGRPTEYGVFDLITDRRCHSKTRDRNTTAFLYESVDKQIFSDVDFANFTRNL